MVPPPVVCPDRRALGLRPQSEPSKDQVRPIALCGDAPILHPGIADYHYSMGQRPAVPHPNLQGYGLNQRGADDLAPLFANAYRVFEHVYHQSRQHQGYLEPHACLVWIDEQDIVHVYSTNKAAFAVRQSLAICTGLPAQQIVVDCMFIGGDFGGKGSSIDEYPCYYLAKATGRPVKSVMTYADELTNANPRHASTSYMRTAVDEGGHMIAHEARIYFSTTVRMHRADLRPAPPWSVRARLTATRFPTGASKASRSIPTPPRAAR